MSRERFPVPSLENESFLEIVSHPDPSAISTPTKPNPLIEQADELNLEWVRYFLGSGDAPGINRLLRTRPAHLAAYAYRFAELEPLVLASDLIAWLFFFDDYHGEGWTSNPADLVRLCDELEAVLAVGALPRCTLPVHTALANVRSRMMRVGGQVWVDRFTLGMRKYFNGCLLEYPYRKAGQCPTLRNYRVLRRWSIGVDPVMDMVELCVGEPLSLKAAARPELHDLRNGCALLCAWVNDIYSFNKETGDRDPINLVSVLKHALDCSYGEAMLEAIGVFHQDFKQFQEHKRAFDARATALERKIAIGYEDWVVGNLTWSAMTRRYKPL